ncbi:hypothetical protein ACR9YC_08960 [Parasphingorhabdus sp. DH2-15]|uniref:hypothetical protein n=1 Tax=Parasphingorhabdus sp. DH2-15 TaxID=3444112 RepID=UPI003F684993
MFTLFENKERNLRDQRELQNLQLRYGHDVLDILQTRANDNELDYRNRTHWRRLLKLAKRSF